MASYRIQRLRQANVTADSLNSRTWQPSSRPSQLEGDEDRCTVANLVHDGFTREVQPPGDVTSYSTEENSTRRKNVATGEAETVLNSRLTANARQKGHGSPIIVQVCIRCDPVR